MDNMLINIRINIENKSRRNIIIEDDDILSNLRLHLFI
jgi:hypothetical protein